MNKVKLICCILPVLFMLQLPLHGSSNKDEKGREEIPATEESAADDSVVEIPTFTVSDALEPEEEVEEPVVGVIRGKVADERGKPIAGVEVSCIDEGGKVIASTLTDEEGNYSFEDLEIGQYTIDVNYSGFSSPVQIKFEEKQKRPPIPTGLDVFEVTGTYSEGLIIRAQWDEMPDVTAYRCELYLSGERTPIQKLPDMLQNRAEFGNLREDTEYQIRVFSKNDFGYSSSYALGFIRTSNKLPPSPFGLGILSAENNKVDIMWMSSEPEDLKGYILQIRKGKGPYLYYGTEGLTPDVNKARIIKKSGGAYETYRIDDRLQDNVPLLENVTPYSFRIFSVDEKGALSEASTPVENVLLADTEPPMPPHNIKYKFMGEGRLRISWESRDRDIEKYRLYYGVNKDRWDGVIYTNKKSHELIVDREQLEASELYITIIAIDRAGNESGYRPVKTTTSVTAGETVTEDIVLSSENMYRDFSIAIKEPPKKVIKRRKVAKKPSPPPPPKEYGISYLREKEYIVDRGETATIKGSVLFPLNAVIKVKSGGRLIIEDAELAPAQELWGGIRFLRGSRGSIQNTVISNAVIGIALLDIRNTVELRNVAVTDSEENGIYIKNSEVELSVVEVRNSKTGILIENSNVKIRNSTIDYNEKGILANNYYLNLEDSQFTRNTSYGLRLYGGGTVKRCIFKSNFVGVVLEAGKGTASLSESVVENNRMDGIVLSASNSELSKNVISGNGRHGIYIRENANPNITENDIVNNEQYAVVGGGIIRRCYIAYNNGSIYIDDTERKGKPDSVFSSSSSGAIKQILNVDFIEDLSYAPVLQ